METAQAAPQKHPHKMEFQLDESKSLHGNWLFHQTPIKKRLFRVPFPPSSAHLGALRLHLMHHVGGALPCTSLARFDQRGWLRRKISPLNRKG